MHLMVLQTAVVLVVTIVMVLLGNYQSQSKISKSRVVVDLIVSNGSVVILEELKLWVF